MIIGRAVPYRAYHAEIDAPADPEIDEIEARLNWLRSPFRTAELFWVEKVTMRS
jgi:hypothetical protein